MVVETGLVCHTRGLRGVQVSQMAECICRGSFLKRFSLVGRLTLTLGGDGGGRGVGAHGEPKPFQAQKESGMYNTCLSCSCSITWAWPISSQSVNA